MNNFVCKHNKLHNKLRASKENPGFFMCDICKDGWRKEDLQKENNNQTSNINQFIFRLDNLNDDFAREHVAFLQASDFLMEKIVNIKADLGKYPNMKPQFSIQATKLDFNSCLKIILMSDMIHVNNHFKNIFAGKNWIRFNSKNEFFIPNAITSYSELQIDEQGIKVFGSYGSYWLDTNLFESLTLSWTNLGV